MGTIYVRGRRIYGTMLWMIFIIIGILFVERSLVSTSGEPTKIYVGAKASEVLGENDNMSFLDWCKVVAIEQLPKSRQNLIEVMIEDDGQKKIHMEVSTMVVKEKEHRIARESLQKWLTPTEKWHFMIGYNDKRALRVARRLTQGARVHYFPTSNNSLHYFLIFMSTRLAELFRKKHVFHVVEPLLPYLKIEDLTLGKLIRDQKDAKNLVTNSHDEPLALKATLAYDALTTNEVQILASRWEVILQLELQDPLFLYKDTTTMHYMDTRGQTGIHLIDEDHRTYSQESLLAKFLHGARTNSTKREMRKSDRQVQFTPMIECQGEVTTIVCSHITKTSLEGVANFMALHAIVQLVELNPRYIVFNKWAKFVTQVGLSVAGW